MGLKDKFKGAWQRVSDLDDESDSARQQASASDRIPYKEISKKVKELMKKNVDVVGRKILIPTYYIIYFGEEDRKMRVEVEEVMCEELKEELYPEMRKINPEQNKRDILVETGTDPNLEKGQFRVDFRMKKPTAEEKIAQKPTVAEPQRQPDMAVAEDNDLRATIIEQAPAFDPDAQATIIQTAPVNLGFTIQVEKEGVQNEKRFTKPKITIGRATQDDIVLESSDFSISRGHATLEVRNGKYYLTAIGVNGTILNGEELELKTEVEVSPGDEIKIMSYVLKII